ncbi:MAG: glutamate-cysteine ligase family protein [Planctomycetota bacterium]|nr:glutamate-cysteine ligase family protein [Planctomycetota bacterium]
MPCYRPDVMTPSTGITGLTPNQELESVNKTLSLTRAQLRQPFEKSGPPKEKIGLEVELAAVDPKTGLSMGYEGPRGIGALLTQLCSLLNGKPTLENGKIIGVDGPNGLTITIEPGGAIEYSSPPHDSLKECGEILRSTLTSFAKVAAGKDVAILATGGMPFNKLSEANWMPKSRYSIMRNYFSSLGEPGSLAHRMMTQTLSVQASYDYHSFQDITAKFPAMVMAAPIATALFANSPLEEGKLTGGLSRRGQIWLKTDPDRCGFVTPALNPNMSIEDYIDWAMKVPMIFRVIDGVYHPMLGKPFIEVLTEGFADGSQATIQDWNNHLSGLFTDARLKNVIEMRSVDGQNFEDIMSVPAFWTGLVYSAKNIQRIKNRLGTLSVEQHQAGLEDLVVHGLSAKYGDETVLDIARDLVAWAKEGLQERIDHGKEDAEALTELRGLETIVECGESRAKQLSTLWTSELKESPELFVERFRIPH